MDINKDGVIDKNDLRGAFDNVGVLMSEGELDGLLGEISGPCTYDNMVKMFQEKMAGEGNDSDDLIILRSVDLAPMTTWSRCSRRRWPEKATTLMTSSSRPSRPTTLRARWMSRCSSMP